MVIFEFEYKRGLQNFMTLRPDQLVFIGDNRWIVFAVVLFLTTRV